MKRNIRIAMLTSILFGLMTSPAIGTHGEAPCEPVAPYRVTGTASNYPTTAGFSGQPVVALPLAMGGCYIGRAHGTVTVCGSSCVELLVVDYCQCYWGSSNQRVVDLSHAAWPLVTDQPLSRGLVEVTVVYAGGDGEATDALPNTAFNP